MTHVPRSSSPARPSWVRSSLFLAVALVALSLAGCAGIFQRDLPETAATYRAFASGKTLLVGAAEADITPTDNQYMGGYSIARVSTGVFSPLKARAMVLVMGEQRFAIVGYDNLGMQREDVDWVKRGIKGFPNGNVILCASHTHAAPDLVGMWGFYFLTSGRDTDYLALVRRGISRAVADALARARPARLMHGVIRLPQGIVRNSNRKGLYDRRFTVIQAQDKETHKPLGTLLHMACHPEIFRRQNTLISADYPGSLCDAWAAAGLGQAVFINGELGAMVTPRFRPKNAKGIPLIGNRLMVLGRAALANAKELVVDEIELRRRDLYFPMESPGLQFARLTMVIPRELYDGHLRSTVGYLRLGSFEAACVPGEMEPGLAGRIREASHRPDLVIFGLADDEVGYLLQEKDAHDPLFLYERTVSPGPASGRIAFNALVGAVRASP